MVEGWSFNPPASWPDPPRGWIPSDDWEPDPGWGGVPPGWQLWVPTPRPARQVAVLGVGGAALVALTFLAVAWLPRMSDAALTAGTRGSQVTDLRSVPVQAGTLTPLPPSGTGPRGNPFAAIAPEPSDPTASVPAISVVPAQGAGHGPVRRFRTCAALKAVHPHGIGLPGAVERIRGGRGGHPGAADFGRSTALHGANRRLDVDRDGIACEH